MIKSIRKFRVNLLKAKNLTQRKKKQKNWILGNEINVTTSGGYMKNLNVSAKITCIPMSIGEFLLFHSVIINNIDVN